MIDLLPAIGNETDQRTRPTSRLGNRLLWIGLGVLWTVAFAVAYTQWPLYTGKQHTKFLHGLAAAGVGHLQDDWLANTLNPLPAFSLLVTMTHIYLDDAVFYAIQALLLGVYLLSLYGVVGHLFPSLRKGVGPLLFLTLLIAIHSTLLPPFNMQTFGMSIGWLLQSGVAGQYMLNPSFEPGSFGVLLILSIYLFLTDRPHWASAAASFAAVMHSAYMLTAAVLVLAYVLIVFWQRRSWLAAVGVGAVGLAVVAPLLLYSSTVLGPTTPELWAQAQDIIVNFRIPHHSLPELWIDNAVYARLAVVVVAILLARKSRVALILTLLLLAAAGLTFAQWALDSDTLAFLAPWR
ncbi:MAG: hypothetical protein HC802_11735, partial [Caldilineaceae bacterium]|nr:hypothetical protein [Caldilineaceae bacterium]